MKNWTSKIKFNSFYYLHIPKTGGRWLSSKLDNLLETFDYHKIKTVNDARKYDSEIGQERGSDDSEGYYEHTGWHPEINEKTFILATFRDPVKQLCSLWTNSNEEAIYASGINKELFLKDIKNESSYLNNQSASLSNSGKLKDFGIGLENLDIDLLIKRIDRINQIILIQDKEIDFSKEMDLLLKTIEINLEVKIDRWRNNTAAYKNKNPMSRSLFNSLSDEEKQYIAELQNLDTALYNRIIEKNSK